MSVGKVIAYTVTSVVAAGIGALIGVGFLASLVLDARGAEVLPQPPAGMADIDVTKYCLSLGRAVHEAETGGAIGAQLVRGKDAQRLFDASLKLAGGIVVALIVGWDDSVQIAYWDGACAAPYVNNITDPQQFSDLMAAAGLGGKQ